MQDIPLSKYRISSVLEEMKRRSDQQVMCPLDVAVLLKIITYGDADWKQQQISLNLHLSQSEISKFVGGAVISIYADDPAADKVRPTQDVDLTLKLLGVNQLPQIHAKEIFGPSENRVTG